MWNRVIFLSVVAAIGVISASLCAPALPFIADHFSTGISSVQFTISLFLMGNAFGQLFSGPLSDQLGQRKVLMGGLFLFILASVSCALSEQMNFLLVSRMFQGMGSAVGPVLARAIAAGSLPLNRSAQVQSYGAMGVGIASMLAIIFSGRITLVSWRGNFWLAAGLGIILVIWAYFALRKLDLERKRKELRGFSIRPIFVEMKEVIRHPDFISNALIHSVTYGLMYGYIALFPFLLRGWLQENSPAQTGLFSAYMIAFYMLGAFVSARLISRFSLQRLIAVALMMQFMAGVLLVFPLSSPLFLFALFLFNLGLGVILPLTSARALAPFRGQSVGAASSALGLFYRLIGSILSMAICQFPLLNGLSLGSAMLLLSAASLAIARRFSKNVLVIE